MDKDMIRQAVELADGFYSDAVVNAYYWISDIATDVSAPDQWFLDALAAQLVRQVGALENKYFLSDGFGRACVRSTMFDLGGDGSSDGGSAFHVDGPDRTMNTIKAIVDSGVLQKDSPE